MNNDHKVSNDALYGSEDSVTDSFPLMLIITTFLTVSVFHLLFIPLAKDFATKFIG